MPLRVVQITRRTGRWSLPRIARTFVLLACLVSLGTAAADDRPVRLPPVHGLNTLPSPGSVIWKSQLRWNEDSRPELPSYEDPTLPLADPRDMWTTDCPDPSGSPWDQPGSWEPDFRSRLPIEPDPWRGEAWTWQVMPLGLLYRSYLAGAKEPRFASYWNRDRFQGDIWDTSLGGRLGLLRYGTCGADEAEGWQLDLEGGCQARLDPHQDSDPLYSVDFRVGFPLTWAMGNWQFKTGYYHISAHLGDEFLIMNPTARRINYTRDAAMLAVGYFWTERLRLYGETAYAVGATDGAQPWEFQFGADYAPARDTGLRGAPFAALNAHLREDVNFGGNLVLQTGWAWRRCPRGSLFRIGVQYYKGKSDQYEYYDRSEERFGWGMWADF